MVAPDRQAKTKSVISIGANSYFIFNEPNATPEYQLFADILGDEFTSKHKLATQLSTKQTSQASSSCTIVSSESKLDQVVDQLQRKLSAKDAQSVIHLDDPKEMDSIELNDFISPTETQLLENSINMDTDSNSNNIFDLQKVKIEKVHVADKSADTEEEIQMLLENYPEIETNTALLQYSHRLNRKLREKAYYSKRRRQLFNKQVKVVEAGDFESDEDDCKNNKSSTSKWKAIFRVIKDSKRSKRIEDTESIPVLNCKLKHHYDPNFVAPLDSLIKKDSLSSDESVNNSVGDMDHDVEMADSFDYYSAASPKDIVFQQQQQQQQDHPSLISREPTMISKRRSTALSLMQSSSSTDALNSNRFSTINPPNVSRLSILMDGIANSSKLMLVKRNTIYGMPTSIPAQTMPAKVEQKIINLHRLCVADDRLTREIEVENPEDQEQEELSSTDSFSNSSFSKKSSLANIFDDLKNDTLDAAPIMDFSSKFGFWTPPASPMDKYAELKAQAMQAQSSSESQSGVSYDRKGSLSSTTTRHRSISPSSRVSFVNSGNPTSSVDNYTTSANQKMTMTRSSTTPAFARATSFVPSSGNANIPRSMSNASLNLSANGTGNGYDSRPRRKSKLNMEVQCY